LPVAEKPVIQHLIEKILRISPPIKKIIVATNLKFQQQFEDWLKSMEYNNVILIPDNSTVDSQKVGAIKALSIITSSINEDFFVLAGDNLYTDELKGFIQFFFKKKLPVVALYHARHLDEVKKGATVVLNNDGQIIEFIEKPKNPKTTLVGACLYIFPSRISYKIKEYVELGLPSDEPGRFIEWLHKIEPIYGYMLKDYLWDIGTPESFLEAKNHFKG
jgi:glucose-1-phosphate thymidylyltransferase